MKKVIFADFMEFNDPCNKLGNYHYAKCFAKDGYEVLWMSCLYNQLLYLKHKEVYKERVRISAPEKHKLDDNILNIFKPLIEKDYLMHDIKKLCKIN